jgi:hypothetical protein
MSTLNSREPGAGDTRRRHNAEATMGRRNFLRLGSGAAIGGTLAAYGAQDGPHAADTAQPGSKSVLGWNLVALQAVRTVRPGPLASARALAVLHTCMYNAWAAYDDDARQTAHGVAVRLPRVERGAASKASAMSHAAWLALCDRFPSQRADFDAAMARLGLDPAAPADQFTPAGIGRSQAAPMLESCRQDGATLDDGAEAGPLPDRWWRLAHYVSARDKYDDDQDVRLCFVLANALADAGHGAAGGAAAAEVLRRFTGSDRLGAAVQDVAPGCATFSEVAEGAAADTEGLVLGREIGALAFDRASRYWQGKL